MFLDAGYDAAYHYYLNRYRSLPSPAKDENFKGRLQQVAQERFGATPFYDSEGARVGTKREYTSVVFAGAEPLGTGHGETKQEAEQDAARAALATLLGAAADKPAAKPVKPRARRSPRKRAETPAPEADERVAAEIVTLAPPAESLPEPASEPYAGFDPPSPEPPEPAEPRSRQFGEPLE
jgi:hypothetical protein